MISIQKAVISDVLEIQKLLHETWLYTYSDYLSKQTIDEVHKKWQSIEYLTKQIKNRKMYFALAKDSNEFIGVATARSVKGITVIFRLYIYPQYQRKGIGQKLLEAIIEHFPSNKKIQLYVEVSNKKGQSFYKKCGFKEIKREKEKIANEIIEQILMEKEI